MAKSSSNTRTGTIKSLKVDKGFGFIVGDDSRDEYFFHFSGLIGVRLEELHIGDHVRFVSAVNTKGPRAEQIERL